MIRRFFMILCAPWLFLIVGPICFLDWVFQIPGPSAWQHTKQRWENAWRQERAQ